MATTKTKGITGAIIFVVLIITGIAAYFLLRKPKNKTKGPESNIDTKTGKAIKWTPDTDFPLQKGSSGNRVKQLQAGLNILKKANLTVDGKFGDKTLAALKEGFGVDSLSESSYNLYIVPNITAINDEINKTHPSNKPKADSSASADTSSPAPNVNFMGHSVSASKDTQGYGADTDADLGYTMSVSQPMNYTPGQFIGLVENDDNGWLRCVRANGSRVFVMKNAVKL